MDRQEKIERGEAAKRILAEPLLVEAFDKLDAGYVKVWREARDPVVREDCHRAVKVIAAIKNNLQQTIQTGEIAAKDLALEEQTTRGKIARIFGA